MQTEYKVILEQLRAAFPAAPIDSRGAFASWGMTYSDGDAYAKARDGKSWQELVCAYLDIRSDALGSWALRISSPSYPHT